MYRAGEGIQLSNLNADPSSLYITRGFYCWSSLEKKKHPKQKSDSHPLQVADGGISSHRHLPPNAAALNPDSCRALQRPHNQLSSNHSDLRSLYARGLRHTCPSPSADLTPSWFNWLVLLQTPPKVGQVGPPTMGLRGAEARSRLCCPPDRIMPPKEHRKKVYQRAC